jgi:hypothetical protein
MAKQPKPTKPAVVRRIRYQIIVEGVLDANDVEQAKLIVKMGFSLSGRLLTEPHEIVIETDDVTELQENLNAAAESNNGG